MSTQMATYLRSVADPFDVAYQQPKFLDGRIDRTAGMRLRTTGTITCETNGFTYVVLFPGISNVLNWAYGANSSTPAGNRPTPFQGFAETAPNAASINRYRMITAGLKLSLVNAADNSDGIYEAIRLTNVQTATSFFSQDNNEMVVATAFPAAWCNDMANNPTYQMGRLRDIHRMLFRLNWRNSELEYRNGATTVAVNGGVVPTLTHDVIVIRVRGRQVASEPSLIMYDTVATHEIEYVEGTALNRLMTYNAVVPNMDTMSNRLNLKTPAIQIS